MEKRPNREGILEKTAQAFDIPGDIVGLPRVEITGDHELRMTNHRGILSYGREEILISGGRLILKVRGADLELKAMNAGELLITGTLFGVSFS